jgi:3,2-trans-enoyl-CoA isomerase
MDFIYVSKQKEIATITLQRGKVNALNESMVNQLSDCFRTLADDDGIRSIILTGRGKFFSFGFDIPGFMDYSKDAFAVFLTRFTNLYTSMFLFPKPIVAALNGHTIAGGCMLACACDYRIMASGKAKISLNELGFGSSVFAGSVAMLKFCIGDKAAQEMLYSAAMYTAEEAAWLGLVHRVCPEENLLNEAETIAGDFARKDLVAFGSIKRLLRLPLVERWIQREEASIREFITIWYSDNTRENLKKIKIHGETSRSGSE